MERKVLEDNLYALEERFKAYENDMRQLLAEALGERKEINFVALEAQKKWPVVTVFSTWDDSARDEEIVNITMEDDTFYFENRNGFTIGEDRLAGSQGLHTLLAAVRNELRAREGIKI